MNGSLSLIAAAQARRILTGAVSPIARTQRVALAAAVGRVLAEPFAATESVPSFPRAMMDGYALRAVDVIAATAAAPVILSVRGSVKMGELPAHNVRDGQTLAIATGGHVPTGADAVVMVERTVALDGDRIAVQEAVSPGRNVLNVGEDIPAGARVIPGGRRMRPQDVAGLAAFGMREASVFVRPRVAILSTGTEICGPDEAPRPGQVRDVNQHLLGAQVESSGCQITRAGIVADDPAALESAVARLLPEHEVVILSGGSSVGGKDFTAEIFARFGEPGVLFHGINCRPGKPTLAARAGEKLLVGLPGVPTSAAIIFEIFVRPALRRLGGEDLTLAWAPQRRALLCTEHLSVRGREDYLRVRLVERDGEIWAETMPGGSGGLSGLVGVDGLIVVDTQMERLAAGVPVTVGLLS